MCCSIFLLVLFIIIIIVRIFLRSDRSIIGRILVHGPALLPVFCRGTRMPLLISVGACPVPAISFSILAIPLCTSGDAWRKCSALILFMPALSFGVSLDIASPTCSGLKGILILQGSTSRVVTPVGLLKKSLKSLERISDCISSFVVVPDPVNSL